MVFVYELVDVCYCVVFGDVEWEYCIWYCIVGYLFIDVEYMVVLVVVCCYCVFGIDCYFGIVVGVFEVY